MGTKLHSQGELHASDVLLGASLIAPSLSHRVLNCVSLQYVDIYD